MSNLILGIDPGLQGAVVAISLHDRTIVSMQDTPTVAVKKGKGVKNMYLPSQMSVILDCFKKQGVLAVGIERVSARPGQGVTSMWSMGFGSGLWIGILAALGLPYDYVEPMAWKRDAQIAVGSDKSASIVRALQLYPTASSQLKRKRDNGRADALLIACYMSRRFTGTAGK